jgi:hypothetical protein
VSFAEGFVGMKKCLVAVVFPVMLVCGCARQPAAPPVAKSAPAPAPGPNEAAGFQEAIRAIHQKVVDATQQFQLGMAGMLGAQNKDLSALTTARDEMDKQLKRARADLKAIQVPNLKGAKPLHEAESRFVEGEESILQLQSKLMDLLQSALSKGEGFDPAALAQKLGDLEKTRQKVKEDLDRAHEEFARENKLGGASPR